MDKERKVWVIGHKNPDTDSICSAIAYADFKSRTTGGIYESKRAGKIGGETKYVLDYFDLPIPEQTNYVGAQVKDIEFRQDPSVSRKISMKKAWELMKEQDVSTLSVVRTNGELAGLVVTSDIATSYMDIYDNEILSRANTGYKNIIETLDGTMLVGDPSEKFHEGKVVVATNSLEVLEEEELIYPGDLVILGNRYDVQFFALEMEAKCIVVCSDSKVTEKIQKKAADQGSAIICTPYDTFTVARLINQSIPIEYFMQKDKLSTFSLEDYIDQVKDVMSKLRHRYFPIMDEENRYVGMLSRRNLMNMRRKQLILVDHNEPSQAVDGIEGAEILEIIDHHRLGGPETIMPIYYRGEPVGCTSTIIYLMFKERNVEITPKIAGAMCSAILSDTLLYRSPTCTPTDKAAAEDLAKIAGIDPEEHAKNMFRAASDFSGKSVESIFNQDFKVFTAADRDFGVGQIMAMSKEDIEEVKERLIPYLETAISERKLNMVFLMLTNILEESSDLIFAGGEARLVAERAFSVRMEEGGDSLYLKGVVSRKKQFIPAVIDAMHEDLT
jgi:manganese-dependent inorganic pyrophosphatase